MFKIIIFYELVFVVFWNVLYFANGDFNSWVGNQFLTAVYTFLSTMALGLTILYVMYISAKLSGFLDKIKKVKDPRRDVGNQ
tara:strand:+ start:11718 stop:11963 length:246 start_codon:yes stop_codon:yes gene_type:complete